jgi:hypothetical protein
LANPRLNVTLDLRLRLRHWRRQVFFRAGAMPDIYMTAVHDLHVRAAAAAERTQQKSGRSGAKNFKGRSHDAQAYAAGGVPSSISGVCPECQ